MRLRSLVVGWLLFGSTLTASAQSNSVENHVYPVADLVHCPKRLPGITVVLPNLPEERNHGPRTVFRPLKENQIAPMIRCLVEFGADEKIEYYPLGEALVVTATPQVHRRVKTILNELRRQTPRDIIATIYFISVSPQVFESVVRGDYCEPHRALKASANWFHEHALTLNAREFERLMTSTQQHRETNILQAPRLTFSEGESAQLDLAKIDSRTDLHWKMRCRSTGDGSHVAIDLKWHLGCVSYENLLCVPLDQYLVVGGCFHTRSEFGPPVLSRIPYVNRMFKNTGIHAETCLAVVKLSRPNSCDDSDAVQGVLTQALQGLVPQGTSEELASIPSNSRSPQAEELLKTYLDALNRHDFATMRKCQKALAELEGTCTGTSCSNPTAVMVPQVISNPLTGQIGLEMELQTSCCQKSCDSHTSWTNRWTEPGNRAVYRWSFGSVSIEATGELHRDPHQSWTHRWTK